MAKRPTLVLVGSQVLLLAASLVGVAGAQSAAETDLKAIWNTLTPEEQDAYSRAARGRSDAASGRSQLTPGDTCAEATFESGDLPFSDNNTTIGLNDDLAFGAACGGFNSESGVGPDIAYRVRTDITCDVEVDMDPTANDLALWVVTDCGDPVGGCVGGDDSGGDGTAEQVAFTADAGTSYFIVVDGFAGASDSFALTISEQTATGCVLVGEEPALSFTPDSHDFGQVPVGGNATFAVTLENTGAGPAENLVINAPAAPFDQTNDCPPTLSPQSQCTVTAEFAPTAGGSFTDTIEAVADGGFTATLSLEGEGVTEPLVFSKSFSPASIAPGGTSTLTFTIDNSASTLDAEDLAFTDTLPAGMTVADPPNLSDGCAGTLTAAPGGDTIEYADGTVAAEASCTISVDVTSATVGSHENTSSELSSSAGTSEPAVATLEVSEVTPPSFDKSFSPASIAPGETSTLTFTIDNTASTLDAEDLAFIDGLPAGLTVADPASPSNDCAGTLTATPGADTIQYAEGTVAAEASCTISVNVTSATPGSRENTSSELSSSSGTSDPAVATLEVTEPVPALPVAALIALALGVLLVAAAGLRRVRVSS